MSQPSHRLSGKPLVGILYMSAAIMMFSLLDIQAKFLAQTLEPMQIAWARYAGHLILMLLFVWPRYGRQLLVTTNLPLQLARSILLLICTGLFFTAIAYMPLADAIAISFVYPLLVTALSVPLLKEPVGARRWTAVAIGFVGAMVILRPGLGVMHWAAVLLLAMSVSFALFQISTRILAAGGDQPLATLFYSAIVGAVIMTLIVPYFWVQPNGLINWAILCGLGLWAGIGHYFLIKAHDHTPIAVLAPLGYFSLLWGALFGYLLFEDMMEFWTVAGALILIATGIYIVYREGLQGRST